MRSWAVLVSVVAVGCTTSHAVQIEPVRVDPIHVTMDIHVQVDGEIDAALEDGDEAADQGRDPVDAPPRAPTERRR